MTSRNMNLARQARNNQHYAEQLLWMHLRMGQLGNLKFRRQYPVGGYIVNFVCLEKRLVVELDGEKLSEEHERNADLDVWLNSKGFKVLRFWNDQVTGNLSGVLETIRQQCFNHTP